MTSHNEFKAAAEKALEHALAWREDGAKLPAFPSATTAELRARFDRDLPAQGLNGEVVIENLVRAAEHGLVNNTHPNFYAWVQGASHPIGVAADILTSAWGQNAAIYQTAPAAAIAEEVSAKWILELLDLPAECSFAFATGATTASFICLSVARSEVLHRQGYDLELEGLTGAPNIQVFLGEEAHATIISNLRYLGFGRKNLVYIAVDKQGRLLPEDLADKLARADRPKIVILQPDASISFMRSQASTRECGLLTCTQRHQPIDEMGLELANNRERTEVQSILEVRMGKGMQPNEDSYTVVDVLQNLQPN